VSSLPCCHSPPCGSLHPLGRYCGTSLPHPIISFGNALTVRFVSDSVYGFDGFHAIYSASTSGEWEGLALTDDLRVSRHVVEVFGLLFGALFI
jgi:hypothetical protein